MKPIQGVNEILSYDKDNDSMYIVKNSKIEKISNNGKIAVGLFPNSSFITPGSLKVYNFDNLLHYSLVKNKPLIGIIEWPYYGMKKENIFEVPDSVVNKVVASGGIPIGIFPTQVCDFQHTYLADMPELTKEEKKDLDDVLSFCSGIIKPGTFKAYEFDKYIHSYTLTNDMPYFGICGGMQIMTYPEGKLTNTNPNKDVGNIDLHSGHDGYAHSIKINHESKLYDILKKDEILVNSKHKKCLPDESLEGFLVSATADDKTVEAIEIPGKSFQIGVQWHPELLDDTNTDKLFNSFIDESNNYKKIK